MRSEPRRHQSLVVTGSVLWLAVAGCGSSDTGPSADRSSADASSTGPLDRTAAKPQETVPQPRSSSFYPNPDPDLADALEGKDPVRKLRALARTFGPLRPSYEEWDRTGHIRVAGLVRGFAREVAAGTVPQLPGRYDLSCAGGFLEGVRLLVVPDLTFEDFSACDPQRWDGLPGAPEACDGERTFGLAALANIAVALEPAQRTEPGGLEAIAVRRRDDLPTPVGSDEALLCTVSHVSRSRQHRYHHHMMILLAGTAPGQVQIFDTTGARGVSLRERSEPAVAKYVKHLLADNDAFDYDPESAVLTCLRVRGF